MEDQEILTEIKNWFNSCLGCAAGKREFSKSRYMLAIARTSEDVQRCFDAYVMALETRESVACLVICPPASEEQKSYSVAQEVRRLGALFSPLAELSAEELALAAH